MKTKIILLTHGGWGEELLQSAQMVVGKIECCETLSLMPEDSISQLYAAHRCSDRKCRKCFAID